MCDYLGSYLFPTLVMMHLLMPNYITHTLAHPDRPLVFWERGFSALGYAMYSAFIKYGFPPILYTIPSFTLFVPQVKGAQQQARIPDARW